MPDIQKVRYTHDAVIDEILINPGVSQAELSRMFGFTQAWMSICINSDAFQNRMAERKAELVDPIIRAGMQERLDAVAKRSLDKIMDRLDDVRPIKDSDLASFAKIGIGDRNNRVAGPVNQNNLYVVNLPPQAASAEDWIANRSDKTALRAPQEVIQDRVGALLDAKTAERNIPRALPLVEEVTRG